MQGLFYIKTQSIPYVPSIKEPYETFVEAIALPITLLKPMLPQYIQNNYINNQVTLIFLVNPKGEKILIAIWIFNNHENFLLPSILC